MRGKDIATAIINRSIDYKNKTGDERYYNNFYCVNKLMYFAHCEYLKQNKEPLISEQEKITAQLSGPFFESTLFIFRDYIFNNIKEKLEQEIQLSNSIKELIDKIVQEYGFFTDQEIGILSKKDEAYLEASNKEDKIITNDMIIKYMNKEKEKIKVKSF